MCETLAQRMEARNNTLIDALIRRIERDCPNAVDMIGICGSFCNGDFHERSDLDLMILINDPKAWEIAECFVIGEVGFDFYCTTWESLESEAECGTAYMAKLMDTKIVYAPNPEAAARYEALREKARAILNAPLCKADIDRAKQLFEDAEKAFAKLMRVKDSIFDARCAVGYMLYGLENAICVLNKTYFKLGTKRMYEEFAAMTYVPENFEEKVRAVVEAETVGGMQTAAAELMRAADAAFAAAEDTLPKEEKTRPTADNIKGCLEEMISNFRGKMWLAEQTGNTHAALSALESLQSFFDDLHAGFDMPRYDALSGFDPKDLKKSFENYEKALLDFKAEYDKADLPLNWYETPEAFAKAYLSEK